MEPLFTDLFSPADKSAWLVQVQQELKIKGAGESIPEVLQWQTNEVFTIDPYYTADDLKSLPLETIQAAQKQFPGWLNAPEQLIHDEKTDNSIVRDALTRGADAFIINVLSSGIDLSRLLNGIKLSDTPIFFRFTGKATGTDAAEFMQALKTIAPYKLKGGLLLDTGRSTAEATRLTADSPQFRTICVSSHAFHNAGATATQELAFLLASLTDTYDQLTEEGLTIEQLVPKTLLSVSVGTSYFLEIAKLRALRLLFSRLICHYSSSISDQSQIHCQTSTFYDAAVTPYTNLIRATTEAMAAVMGGCDVLTVHPYDTVLHTTSHVAKDREFADRIARNVSILLKEESYLDKVADPSAGSYYVENLTNQLIETAWTLFLNIEKRGGFKQAFVAGFIQREIDLAYQARIEAIRMGKLIVGVTKFRSDEATDQTSKVSNNPAGSLPDRRLAEPFE